MYLFIHIMWPDGRRRMRLLDRCGPFMANRQNNIPTNNLCDIYKLWRNKKKKKCIVCMYTWMNASRKRQGADIAAGLTTSSALTEKLRDLSSCLVAGRLQSLETMEAERTGPTKACSENALAGITELLCCIPRDAHTHTRAFNSPFICCLL